MKHVFVCLASVTMILVALTSSAQFLNKLKQKAENKLENSLDKKLGTGQPKSGQGSTGTSTNQGGNANGGGLGQNQSGGGLISTPPDVNQNLADGEVAFKGGNYGEARYSIQQAMLGVELEIGNKILKSLPEAINGLKKDPTSDKVTSSGFGWAGLSIERIYSDSREKEFKSTIANNSIMMSALNLYFTNGGYAQQTGGQQNWKQIKVRGYRAIIEFNEGSGYKVSVPLGQSSLIIYEGVNFATEKDMMTASSVIDIDVIKKMLGEQ